jgi:hypothetical protein
VRKTLVCFAALILLCAAAFGQALPTAEGPRESIDLFGGYSFGHGDFSVPGRLTGWDAGVAVRLSYWFAAEAIGNSIEGTSTNAQKIHMNMLSAAAGPKFMYPIRGRFVPWAHALFGASRLHTTFPFPVTHTGVDRVTGAMDYGFGLDVELTRRIAIRPAEMDLLQTGIGVNGATNVYYAAGLIFHFPL